MTRRPRLLPLAAALVALASTGCPGDDIGARDGLYLGPKVTFRVSDGRVTDVRLAGIECRVPHPDNDLLALCLQRAPGLPDGTIGIAGGSFSGPLEGGVVLSGRFDGAMASGTWRFETTCQDGSACQGDGEWSAEWRADPKPPEDAVADADPGDAGPETKPGDAGPSDGGSETIGPDPPPTASELQKTAHTIVNTIRGSVGVAPMDQIEGINAAAQAHADYYTQHAASYQQTGLSPHSENPEWTEGFTGQSIGQRLAAQGVSGGAAYEIMAFVATAQAAIDGWMDTLYHRIPIIHPSARSYGYGGTTSGATSQVMDVLYGSAPLPGPARWPLPEATDVDSSWNGGESPQPPLPQGEYYPSGPIVTVTWPRGTTLSLTRAVLLDDGGAEIPAQVQSPANDQLLESTWALYATAPLASQATYTVVFEGSVGGNAHTETWSFTTR